MDKKPPECTVKQCLVLLQGSGTGCAWPDDNNHTQNLLHPCVLESVLSVICELFAVNEVLLSCWVELKIVSSGSMTDWLKPPSQQCHKVVCQWMLVLDHPPFSHCYSFFFFFYFWLLSIVMEAEGIDWDKQLISPYVLDPTLDVWKEKGNSSCSKVGIHTWDSPSRLPLLRVKGKKCFLASISAI